MKGHAIESLRRLDRLPWVTVSPITCARLTTSLTDAPLRFYIKRDGLQGAGSELYGGNKLRKLAFALPSLLTENPRALCTVGGEGSHHVLATITAARSLGLEAHVALTSHPHSEHSQSIYRLIKRLASSVSRLHTASPEALYRSMSAWRDAHSGGWLPTGGSSVASVFGMVEGALELRAQIDQRLIPKLNRIYIASASGSSLAGLLLGLSIAWSDISDPPQVLAVRVTSKRLINRKKTLKLYQAAARQLAWERAPPPFELITDHIGRGYAHPTPLTHQAMEWGAELKLLLEHSYTAKALGALVTHELNLQKTLPPQGGATSLFWHTLDERPPSLLLQ